MDGGRSGRVSVGYDFLPNCSSIVTIISCFILLGFLCLLLDLVLCSYTGRAVERNGLRGLFLILLRRLLMRSRIDVAVPTLSTPIKAKRK